MPKKLTPKQQAQRAERSLKALELGSLTQADQTRLGHAIIGIHALDDEQARVKKGVETLLEAFEKDQDVGTLVLGLRSLLDAD